MKPSHCGEVGRQSLRVALLQLLDEGLDIGGDCLFRGLLLWLLRFEVLGEGGDVGWGCDGGGVHGCSLLGLLPLLFMPCVACTYMPNATWRRRGSKVQGRGLPTLGEGAEGGTERA